LQDLFLAAIDAGISHDPDIDQCCESLAQLVTNQQERTLVRDFFHQHKKNPIRKLSTSRTTEDPSQLVELAATKRQEHRITSSHQTSSGQPNPTPPRRAPPHHTPRPGDQSFSFSYMLQNDSH
uniref:DUF5726 domain-containing protein n=1 Tax=Taenia asiatica TaxID=60517 RepID=A0A0R3VYM0_TAEAS